MRKVFVVCDTRFPRGSALANYLQYLMQALQCAGYEAYLLTDLNQEFLTEQQNLLQWHGISICPIIPSHNPIMRRVEYKAGLLRKRMAALRRLGLGASDVVIVLSTASPFLLALLRLRKKLGFKIIGGLLELFEEKDFPQKRRKWQYWQYRTALESIFPRFDAIMPISTFIEKRYASRGMQTFCVPIMADCAEYPVQEKSMDAVRFIIPANSKMKDDLPGMVRCFLHFPESTRRNIELHLCGVSEATLRGFLSQEEYETLRNMLVIHSWMVYDDLVALYQRVHFLLLSRDVCQMTLANFPSKVPETMDFGIVPIASEVGDYTKYYLEDGKNSIFIRGCGEQACYEAVRKALQTFPERFPELSRNARRCVEEKFDYHVWVPVIQKMIETVATEGKTPQDGDAAAAP